MFATFFQMLGLTQSKPIQSRADASPQAATAPAVDPVIHVAPKRHATSAAVAQASLAPAQPQRTARRPRVKPTQSSQPAASPAKPKAATRSGAPAQHDPSDPVVATAVVSPAGAATAKGPEPILRVPRAPRSTQAKVPSMAAAVASTAAKSSYSQADFTALPTPMPYVIPKKDPKLADNWKLKPLDQLSDDDILSMPESEYMNDVQMAFFRLKLVRLKQDILSNAGETTEHLREETVVVPDPADRATIEEEHALELRTRDRERKLLKKIEQAIARVDSGDYGYCDETGEPIGAGRLIARPTATLSLEAQQRRELKQKMFGD